MPPLAAIATAGAVIAATAAPALEANAYRRVDEKFLVRVDTFSSRLLASLIETSHAASS
jgi:hypothetical protein